MAYFKKILIVFLLILVLFLNLYNVFASSVTVSNIPNTDIVSSFSLEYDNYFRKFVYGVIQNAKLNNGFNQDITTRFKDITENGNRFKFGVYDSSYVSSYFSISSSSSSFSPNDRKLYFALASSSSSASSNYHINGSANTTSSSSSNLTTSKYNNTVLFELDFVDYSINIYLGSFFIIDFFDNYIPSDIFSTIYAIGSSTYDYSSDTSISSIYTELNSTNTFLENTTTDNYVLNDLPQSTIVDPTENLWNTIFYGLYNALADTSVHVMTLTFPFGDNPVTITLSSNTLDFVRSNTVLMNFFTAFWSFAIYYFIIKDIYSQINDLSQGHIDDKVDNVKTTLL